MQCPICFSDQIESYHRKNGYQFYHCSSCQLVFVWPMPENLAAIYNEEYFKLADLKKGFGYINYNQDREAMRNIFLKYLEVIKKYTGGKKIFDVGAASGYFLNLAEKQGWQTAGIEISESAAQKARQAGQEVATGKLIEAALAEKFDAVTMWDVLEHVDNPQAYVKKINQLLEDNGLFAFTTIDRGSLWARLWGKRWQLFIPPEHIFYYSKANLKILLQSNGFEILEIKKIGRRSYLPYIFKMLYNWQKLNLWRKLYYYSLNNNFLRKIVVPVNLRDNVFILARKIRDAKEKRIAIFHNFMDNIGGAEMVGLTLARGLKADFYSTNIDEEKISKMGFSDVKIKSIGKIPVNAPFRQQLALWRFRRLNLKNQYDLHLIAGDWAVSAAAANQPNLWYVHSPIREIWDLYEYTRKNTVPKLVRPIFDLWVRYNRHLNLKYVKKVNQIVCNSNNTKKRVEKYLNRQSEVVNPMVDTAKFHYNKNGDFWLSVNRLVPYKRVDLQLAALAKLPAEKLVVVGCYEKARHFKKYSNYIKAIKPANVEILSWVGEQELIDLYANCKGFIATSEDEDFGLSVVEAMAAGKPVVAPNEGGYKETVINGATGKLIDNINEDKLVEAIIEVGKDPAKFREACLKRAKEFDTQVFIEKIKKQITPIL